MKRYLILILFAAGCAGRMAMPPLPPNKPVVRSAFSPLAVTPTNPPGPVTLGNVGFRYPSNLCLVKVWYLESFDGQQWTVVATNPPIDTTLTNDWAPVRMYRNHGICY